MTPDEIRTAEQADTDSQWPLLQRDGAPIALCLSKASHPRILDLRPQILVGNAALHPAVAAIIQQHGHPREQPEVVLYTTEPEQAGEYTCKGPFQVTERIATGTELEAIVLPDGSHPTRIFFLLPVGHVPDGGHLFDPANYAFSAQLRSEHHLEYLAARLIDAVNIRFRGKVVWPALTFPSLTITAQPQWCAPRFGSEDPLRLFFSLRMTVDEVNSVEVQAGLYALLVNANPHVPVQALVSAEGQPHAYATTCMPHPV